MDNQIEPKIKPLVEALNASNLLLTFSSCEGHPGFKDPNNFSRGDSASVTFDLVDDIEERKVESFFAFVLNELGLTQKREIRNSQVYET